MTTKVLGADLIERIQGDLADRVGEQMSLRANLGRSKVIEAVGILERAHPKLFVLRVNEGERDRTLSYSYSDLITKTVTLSDVDTQSNLLSWLDA